MSTPPLKEEKKLPQDSPGVPAAATSSENHDPDSRDSEAEQDSDPAARLLDRHRKRTLEREQETRDRDPSAAQGGEPLAVGARVRVLRGTFAGKSGVIQEMDGRGGARVMLGLLSARIDLTDLAPEAPDPPAGGRDRLTFSSSHRKPR